MPRATFGQIKSTIATVLNLNASDSRVLSYTNRAQERLLYSGKWVDTVATYAICTASSCLTWPRDIETIEAVQVCGRPFTVRNGWYEFLDSGPGWQSSPSSAAASGTSCCLGDTLVDKGPAISFDDITTTGYKLAVYCDANEAAGAQILIRYYDLNGNKVYSTVGGVTEEGEFLTLPAGGAYVYSTREVLPFGWYGVVKPATNRVIRVYAFKISDSTLKPLAYYEPDETVPVYRRSLIPAFQSGCNASSGVCSDQTVIVRAKLRFIPAVNDNSTLLIPHMDAIRLACQAIRKEENNMLADAVNYWGMAADCLNKQLHHVQGDGAVAPIRVETYDGPLLNLV